MRSLCRRHRDRRLFRYLVPERVVLWPYGKGKLAAPDFYRHLFYPFPRAIQRPYMERCGSSDRYIGGYTFGDCRAMTPVRANAGSLRIPYHVLIFDLTYQREKHSSGASDRLAIHGG